MLLKTLGVLVVTALSFFTIIYWMTDAGRQTSREQEQQEELHELGLQLFGRDSLFVEVGITDEGFAQREDPADPESDWAPIAELHLPVNGSIHFVNETPLAVTVSSPEFELEVPADGGEADRQFTREGTVEVRAQGSESILGLTVGPDALNAGAANCARCHGDTGEGGVVPGSDPAYPVPNLRSVSLADKYRRSQLVYVDRSYIELVIRYGGVVVTGNVNSPMPAWSYEVGGPLNEEQIAAVTALVESWAEETLAQPQATGTPVPDTPEAGREVYLAPGTGTPCSSCHRDDLSGVEGTFPNIQTIGSALVTDLPTEPAHLDQMIDDYEQDKRLFLEKWIRDSAGNYNDGTTLGMPAYTEEQLPEDALQALITYLLEQR